MSQTYFSKMYPKLWFYKVVQSGSSSADGAYRINENYLFCEGSAEQLRKEAVSDLSRYNVTLKSYRSVAQVSGEYVDFADEGLDIVYAIGAISKRGFVFSTLFRHSRAGMETSMKYLARHYPKSEIVVQRYVLIDVTYWSRGRRVERCLIQ